MSSWFALYILLGTVVASNQLGASGGDTLLRAFQQYGAVALASLLTTGTLVWVLQQRYLPRLSGTPWGIVAVVLLLMFYGWALLSAVWSSAPWPAFQKAVALLATTSAAVCVAWRLDAVRAFRAFVLGLAVLTSTGLLMGLADLDSAFMYGHQGPFSGAFSNRNGAASSAAFAATVTIALWSVGKLQRWHLMSLLIMLAATVTWAGSTGGWILLLAGPALVYVAWSPKRVSVLIALGVSLAIVAISLGVALPGVGLHGSDLRLWNWIISTHNRLPLWVYSIRELADAPWHGFGMLGFWTDARLEEFWSLYGYAYANAHNGYVHILVEQGASGLLLFSAAMSAVLFSIVHRFRQVSSAEIVVCAAFVMSFLLCNLVEYYLLRGTQFVQTLFTYAVFRMVFVSGLDVRFGGRQPDLERGRSTGFRGCQSRT